MGVPLVVRTRALWIALCLLVVWIGATALSTLGPDWRRPDASLKWTLILSALFVAAAVTRPLWSGWAILALGAVHIAANLAVYWKNYYSLGASFPSAGLWWSTAYGWTSLPLPARSDWAGSADLLGFPYPEGPLNRVVALIVEVPQTLGYQYYGLSGNPNYTGDYFAPFLVFAVAFLLTAQRSPPRRTCASGAGGRATGTRPPAPPRSGRPQRPARRSGGIGLPGGPGRLGATGASPYVAAIVTPLLLLAPPLLSWTTGASFTGRDCVWRSWSTAVRDSPLWGVGAPGHLTDVCPAPVFIVNAHNELLQAWSVGGLVGLFAFIGFVCTGDVDGGSPQRSRRPCPSGGDRRMRGAARHGSPLDRLGPGMAGADRRPLVRTVHRR